MSEEQEIIVDFEKETVEFRDVPASPGSLPVDLQSDYDALERVILSHWRLRNHQREAALKVLHRIVQAANDKEQRPR